MNHSFDTEIAQRYGVEAAIIIENFRFWIAKNKANERHLHDGRYWTYNSTKAMCELFPYWSQSQIARIIHKLEEAGVLLSGNFNTSPYDRTKWYALSDEIHLTNSQNGKCGVEKSTSYGTDINTDDSCRRADQTLPNCPHDQIVSLYHEQLPELPSVRLQSEGRQKAMRGFWRWVLTSKKSDGQARANGTDQALTWISAYFERARGNDFLMGRTARNGAHAGWVCDFDFLLTEKGRKQVIEKTADTV